MVSVIDHLTWFFYIQDKECEISSGIIHYMLQPLDSQHKIGVKRTRTANLLCHCSESPWPSGPNSWCLSKHFTLQWKKTIWHNSTSNRNLHDSPWTLGHVVTTAFENWTCSPLPCWCTGDGTSRIHQNTPAVARGRMALHWFVEAALSTLWNEHIVFLGLFCFLQGWLKFLITWRCFWMEKKKYWGR